MLYSWYRFYTRYSFEFHGIIFRCRLTLLGPIQNRLTQAMLPKAVYHHWNRQRKLEVRVPSIHHMQSDLHRDVDQLGHRAVSDGGGFDVASARRARDPNVASAHSARIWKSLVDWDEWNRRVSTGSAWQYVLRFVSYIVCIKYVIKLMKSFIEHEKDELA